MAFGNKLLGQTTDTIVPADYGLVLLTLSAAVILANVWMNLVMGGARRRYKVPYPNAYADPAKNEHADAFNRVQWPRLAAGIGFVWIVCRVVYFQANVFGYESKNLRMLADAYAKEDYGQDKEKQEKLFAWLKKHPVKDEGVHKQLDSLFEALHNQYSISKLFVEGFCWGGNYALELAATDKIDAAVITHGSRMEPSQVEAIRQPTAFLWAESDDPELLKKVREITENKSHVPSLVKMYPGTKHGFGIRGSWDNTKPTDDPSNSATTAAAQEAFADASDFFSQYNSGSPSWVQKGRTAALVAGVAALAIFAVKALQSDRK
eukprot:jgi/Astpho2/673/fgenesh1_pg.00013_%23_67_t